jgi:hypothetical protein
VNRISDLLRGDGESGRSWHTLLIPALKKLRQEDCELEANQGYKARCCLIKRHQTPSLPCSHHVRIQREAGRRPSPDFPFSRTVRNCLSHPVYGNLL